MFKFDKKKLVIVGVVIVLAALAFIVVKTMANKDAVKPEVKPEVKTEVKPEAKPEVKPVAPEAKPAPKVEEKK